MPLPIHPGASAPSGDAGVTAPSGNSPLGRMLEGAGHSLQNLGMIGLEADRKRKELESKLLLNQRFQQAVLDMDAQNSEMQKDPGIGWTDGGGMTKPITAFGKFYEKSTKNWYKGLNDRQSAELDQMLLTKSLEYKTKAQGYSDQLLIEYGRSQATQGAANAERSAASNPFSMEDPTGFYQRTLSDINTLEDLKAIGKDEAGRLRTTLTKTTAFAAAQGMIQADPETYQALRDGVEVQFSEKPEENQKMNEQAKRVIANLDGSQRLQLDRQAQQTIEHRATKARVEENAALAKEEKVRKEIIGPFQAKLWEAAMKPGTNVTELMDQAFAAGPAGPGIPGPDGTVVRLKPEELNNMRTTLMAISREGPAKSDSKTLADFYVDLDSGQRYSPANYATALEDGKITQPHFTALVSAWHTRQNTDRTESRADLRQSRTENRRQIDKFFDIEGITEVFTEERRLLYLQANSAWMARAYQVKDPKQLDEIRREILTSFEPQMKGKIRDEITKSKAWTQGYESLADLEGDIQKGTVRGIDARSPRQVNDLRAKVKRYEELVKKAQDDKVNTPPKTESPSRSNPIRKLFGGSK